MKRLVKIMVVLGLAASTAQAGTVFSHTFFSVRPNFQSAMPERVALFRDELSNQCQCGVGGSFETVFYGGRTTREGSEKLAQFFLPNLCNNCCLNFKEFDADFENRLENPARSADYDPAKDVEARNFNIVTNNGAASLGVPTFNGSFASRVCFKPEQQKFGIGFVYRHALSFKCDGSVGFWFEGSLPIERVRNRICIAESIENSGGGADLNTIGLDNTPHVSNVTEAFAQPGWRYGRIDGRCQREKWGIADVELKFGYNSINTPCANLNSYFGIVIPAGNRVRAFRVFEPIIGNNHHFGILFGNSIGFALWRNCNWSLNMYIDGATRYLLSNRQRRSFDLVGKPWSRYQEVYSSSEQAARAAAEDSSTIGTSGINVFTTCFKVHPHFSSDLTTAFVLANRCGCVSWQLELGYNLWARQAEHLELECCNVLDNVAIKNINGDGATNAARNIKQNFQNSAVTYENGYLRINRCDIDLESAAHPAVVSNIVYGAIGIKGDGNCPCFTSIGGSYEFTHRNINTALNRWLIWGKFGCAF